MAERASGYGIPGVVVDGADVLACYAAVAGGGRAGARGEGPTLIEAKVIRLTAHSSDDQQTKYRSEEELAEQKVAGPAAEVPGPARDAGVLTDEIEARIAAEIKAEVDDATDYAETAARPGPRRRR